MITIWAIFIARNDKNPRIPKFGLTQLITKTTQIAPQNGLELIREVAHINYQKMITGGFEGPNEGIWPQNGQ